MKIWIPPYPIQKYCLLGVDSYSNRIACRHWVVEVQGAEESITLESTHHYVIVVTFWGGGASDSREVLYDNTLTTSYRERSRRETQIRAGGQRRSFAALSVPSTAAATMRSSTRDPARSTERVCACVCRQQREGVRGQRADGGVVLLG